MKLKIPAYISVYIPILFLSGFFFSPAAKAEFTKAKCSEVLFGSGEIQVNRQWDIVTGLCFIDIHPRNVVDLKYRDFYFDNRGHLMVFNSYGEGPDSEMTAARDFFIFPIVEDYPDFSVEENGDVIVKLVSGHLFRIAAKDFSVVSMTPGTFIEKPLSPNNKGGFDFNLKTGFWIDGGFKKGASPLADPSSKSTLKSSKTDKSCALVNKDFLTYTPQGSYSFKLAKEKLTAFLKQRCPQVSL